MPDGRSATPRGRGSGASYIHEWNRFVAWSDETGKRHMPASPQDVAAYMVSRSEAGARASSLKVAAAAITHYHREAGYDSPLRRATASTILDELTRDETPGPSRALPLDLDCFLAIRRTACEPRSGRGGRMERAATARRRGTLDVAMIAHMRDARLRVGEPAELFWRDLEQLPDGTGLVRVGDASQRVVSSHTMGLLSSLRMDAEDDDSVLKLRPNQISQRIGAAARQAGLGDGYSGDSPRLGMIRDLETLGVCLMGEYAAAST